MNFTESILEDAVLEYLAELGWSITHGPDISPEGAHPDRSDFSQLVLEGRL